MINTLAAFSVGVISGGLAVWVYHLSDYAQGYQEGLYENNVEASRTALKAFRNGQKDGRTLERAAVVGYLNLDPDVDPTTVEKIQKQEHLK